MVTRGRNFQFRLILLALVVSFIVASSAAVSHSQGSYKSDPAYVRARQVFTRARSLPNFSQLQSNDNRFNALYANLANVLSAIDSGRSDMVNRGSLTELGTDNLNAYSDALLSEYLEPGKPVTSAPSSAARASGSSSGWVEPAPQPTPQIDLTSYGGPPPSAPIKTVSARNGEDLGLLINAANAELVLTRKGSIAVTGGGILRTQAVVDVPITFDGGTYDCQTQTPWGGCILLGDGVTAKGTWTTPQFVPSDTAEQRLQKAKAVRGTTFIEPTYRLNAATPAVTIFQAKRDTTNSSHTDSPQKVSVIGFHFVGAQTVYDGGIRSTIQFGNCHDCLESNNFYDTTASIAMEFGGDPAKGNYSKHCLSYRSVFFRVPAANLAAINSEDTLFIEPTILAPSRNAPWGGGVSGVDLEPNTPVDRMTGVGIYNAYISFEGSERYGAGNGIAIQNPYRLVNGKIANVTVANTIIRGGFLSDLTRTLSNGIFVNGEVPGLKIINTFIRGTGQSCISLAGGGEGYLIRDVRCESTASAGSSSAIELHGIKGAQFIHNYIYDAPGTRFSTASIFRECDDSRNNVFKDNVVTSALAKQMGAVVSTPCR